MWSLTLTTPPAAEPVLVDPDVLQHCRIDSDVAELEAVDLAGKIKAAREACEHATERQLITATWTLQMDCWAERELYRNGAIHVPRPPLASVTSVKFYDTAGNQQTWAAGAAGYLVDAPSGPEAQRGRIYPAPDVDWPDLQDRHNAVEVIFVAGYGAAGAAVPERLRRGILLYVGELYERREESVVGVSVSPTVLGAERLWQQMRAY